MSAFKTEWIAALRSGRYKQATGHLYAPVPRHEYFCCLGVAADINGHLDKDTGWTNGLAPEQGLAVYPGPHSELTGPTYPCPANHTLRCDLDGAELVDICTHLNDTAGWDFGQIADWLEGIDF